MNFIIRKFIKDYQKIDLPEVRERYGTFVSTISIICNIVLALSKLFVGMLAKSISIQADALNNFSDVGSNLATLFGFKLARKHPDVDHPYGHGRYEYISGMIIAFLIVLVAFQSLKEALLKIIHPETVDFSVFTLIVLILSILVKFMMARMNASIGEKIDSTSLKAASQDSYNDMMSTFAALVSMLISAFSQFNVDGWIGLLVSLLVLKSGIEVFKDTIGPLLGQAPDKELVKQIEDLVLSFEGIIGIHDFMLHDYGPGRSFVTLHCEVDSHNDLEEIHDRIDLAEREILKQFHIHATIHLDPIDSTNEEVIQLKAQVLALIREMDENYTIHDFRIVKGKTHTNILFDIVVPTGKEVNEISLKQDIDQRVKTLNENYYTVVNVDHAYY